MSILARVKKKAQEGFQSLVCSLEQSFPEKRAEIFQMAVLEDPVYMKWVAKNLQNINYLFEMNQNDLTILIDLLPNNLQTLIKAVSDHPKKSEFYEKVAPPKFSRPLKDEMSFLTEVSVTESTHAKILLMKTLRELQEKNKIEGPRWQFPEQTILTSFPSFKEGTAVIRFEDGVVAAEGLVEKGKRAGPWKHYYDTGKILAEGNYELGSKWGDWTFYYPSGEKKAHGPFYEDSKHGKWIEWSRSGEEKEFNYEMGKQI